MSKYKVGDRVRLIDASGDSTSRARVGDVGTVESLGTYDKNLLRVRMDDGHLTSRKDYRFELAQYKPVKGDRVRVVLEGEVENRGDRESTGFSLQDETFYTGIDVEAPFVVSIEKIEPGAVLPDGLTISEDGSHLNWLGENYVRQQVEDPVEVFKPGDVVRERTTGVHYALAVDGWTLLNGRDSRHYRKNATGNYVGGEFNSVTYERVNLS